jgi:predicted DNA-binding protein YlxM (UPF0122 family)
VEEIMKKELTPRERKLLKKVRIKELMEVHSGLLTDREKRILTLYSDPNLSGALIARRLNVSRQAIHDHVNRALAKMENCESKMHLLVTRKKRYSIFAELQGVLESAESMATGELLKKLKEIKKLVDKLSSVK